MARREQHGVAGLNPQSANRTTNTARADDADPQLAATCLREDTQRSQSCEQGRCAACAEQRTARAVKAPLLPHRELLVPPLVALHPSASFTNSPLITDA